MGEWDGPLYSTSRSTAFSTNPFENAVQMADFARQFVESQFSYVKTNILGSGSADSVTATNEAIAALRDFELELPQDLELLEPEFDLTVGLELDLPSVNVTDFGSITPYTPGPAPEAGTLPNISDVTIPKFNPSISGITIPDAPNSSLIPDPGDAPDAPNLVFPDSPDIVLPDRPLLYNINLPDQPNVELPILDLNAFPTLPDLNVDTLIPWSEPEYSPEIWTDVKAQLQTFLAGGTGMRPDVEEAITNRGKDREDRIVRQQVAQAIDEWASRGYTAPPGLLAKQINNIQEEGTIKKLGLQREVVIKAMEQELENLRFACQQGIAAENLFVQIHLAAMERLFLVQRLHVELQIQYYQVLVEAFKAKLTENQIRAQVYEVQVRAALAQIEVYKALIEAESVKVDMNKALIESYKAEIEVRETLVDIYEAQVRAVAVRADVFGTEINAYRGEIEAYAARINADKNRFDAYESRIRGEAAKVGIIEAEARAYQAEIGGIEAGVRAETAALEGEVERFRAEIAAYQAQLAGQSALAEQELRSIQANVAGYQADTQRFIAATGAEEAGARLELGAWEAQSRVEVAHYQAQLQRFQALLEKVVKQGEMALEGIKSAGSLASTISAGALAAMHVGATMNGSGAVSASGSDAVNTSFSQAQSRACSDARNVSITFEADSEPSSDCPI